MYNSGSGWKYSYDPNALLQTGWPRMQVPLIISHNFNVTGRVGHEQNLVGEAPLT